MGKSQSQVETSRKIVKSAGLVFCIFYFTEHQTGLSALLPLSLSLSLLPFLFFCLLLSCYCSRRLIPLRASPAFHMLIYCQQTHVAFVSALLARLSGRQFSSPCSCCHLYIPFLIKVDKCPPPPAPPLLSTVIEQLLKIDYENRLLKFFMHSQANELSRN